jgi:polysaccharide export outer membrane protein
MWISKISSLRLLAALMMLAGAAWGVALAQTASSSAPGPAKARAEAAASPAQGAPAPVDDQYFEAVYRNFYKTYRLGPDDEIAIRVMGQPDYSIEKGRISPLGRIYHPLVGDLDVAGLTIDQLTQKLTTDFSEYLINPKVSVSLLEAKSAKVAVLGEVVNPGIVVMTEPMTVLDAISASGGFADTGSRSNVTLLRQTGHGRWRSLRVNVKHILEGKADAEENLALQAGDTVIVHGNAKKKLATITSVAGFASFLSFLIVR